MRPIPTDTPPSSAPPRPPELRRKGRGTVLHILLLLILASLLFLPGLGKRDLWAPNEPTYGQVVLEMSHRGEYLVPTLDGRTFAEKPILYFWLARASGTVLGTIDELSLRLPVTLCGIASVVLVYLLMLPYADRLRARMTALIYMTIFMVYWGSRTVQMDMLVLGATLGAIFFISRVVDHGFPAYPGWALFGVRRSQIGDLTVRSHPIDRHEPRASCRATSRRTPRLLCAS